MSDEDYMSMALHFAEKGVGWTAPNDGRCSYRERGPGDWAGLA